MPVAILMVLATLTVSTHAPGASAQDDDTPHPGHIHEGSCAQLGDVVFPLQDVTSIAGGEALGARSAVPVEASETEVEVPLGDLLTGQYAINLHRSARAIQDYIACGDVGGRVVEGKLVIGLREVDDSGYSGVALLEEDGDETDVTVYLIEEEAAPEQPSPTAEADETATAEPDEAEATAEPEAETPTAEPEAETPTAEAEQATPEPVAIDIVDFAFEPATIEVPVGTTVTWTNQGQAPHTVTSDDGAFDSGTLQPGATFSAIFEAPGTFAYHCDFHPDMTATVVVTAADGAAAEGDLEAAAPAGGEAAVEIRDFSYNPDPIEIAVGDTITWTNQDGVPHTATARDRDVLQSGAIAPGESFRQTFEEAGEFEYFCEFHAGMTGTIVVQ